MKIRFVRHFGPFRPQDFLDLETDKALWFVRNGLAVKVPEPSPKPVVEPVREPAPEPVFVTHEPAQLETRQVKPKGHK